MLLTLLHLLFLADLQLGSYKVKVMLAEPKTKRQRPEQLVPGLFGPGGALGHLPPLGLDAASERALWGACWRGGAVQCAVCGCVGCMLFVGVPLRWVLQRLSRPCGVRVGGVVWCGL
jgi:hypothetical protein